MIKILAMNGPAESGKGTVAKYLRLFFDLDVVEYSSIDYVKEVAKKSFGWDGEKTVEGRNLLAAIKQLMIGYNDLPLKKVVSAMKEAILFDVNIMVVDIREPDEIEKLVNYCKQSNILCHTCRIHNAHAEHVVEISGHSLTGDRLYGKYDYDINITNDGSFEELAMQVNTVFGNLYGQDPHILDAVRDILKENKDGK